MSSKQPAFRPLAWLGSLRLAIGLIVALALVCAGATFYESSHGTPAAQRDVYRTGWFALLLVLIGVNVTLSMVKRFPWKAHHAGFVLSHVGILLLLVGSLVSLHFGLDASLALYEGESSAWMEGAADDAQEARGPALPLPFTVTLLDFRSDKYPGSSMAATYESLVRVDDPEAGTFERWISMNQPLHHQGYVFFQASYVEGQPMMSILSVARAPGLPVVYLGTTLLCVGVFWMFYVVPAMARHRAARALAEREECHASASSVGTAAGLPARAAGLSARESRA